MSSTEFYNQVYESGNWQKRYGNKVNLRSEMVISQAFKSLDTKEISALDFGAGDGRLHHLYERMARRFKSLDIVAFDISAGGLRVYQDRLLEQGYEVVQGSLIPEAAGAEYSGVGPTLQKGNLKVTLACGAQHETIPQHWEYILKANHDRPFDISLAEFGPVAAIPGRKNRQETLKMLAEKTSSRVIFNVPNDTPEIRAAYHVVKNYDTTAAEERARYGLEMPGDFVVNYGPQTDEDKAGLGAYTHLYTAERLREDMRAAGMPEAEIQANKLSSEGKLTNRLLTKSEATGEPLSQKEWNVMRHEDVEFSAALPEVGLQYASYLLVDMDCSKNRVPRL